MPIIFHGSSYTDGKQPCSDFNPGGASSRYNYHECPGCTGTRRFCENCNRDHHEGGWDNCDRRTP